MSDEYVATTIYGVKYPNHLQEKAEKIYQNTGLDMANGVASGDNVIGVTMCSADYSLPVAATSIDDVRELQESFIDKGMAAKEEFLELLESESIEDGSNLYCVLERV